MFKKAWEWLTSPMEPTARGFRWTVLAFVASFVFISSLLVWQLSELTPTRWCALADTTSDERINACLQTLLKILDLKDHTLIGLLFILGLIVLSIVVVVLGVRVSGSGPGGVNVSVETDDGTDITIPAPATVKVEGQADATS